MLLAIAVIEFGATDTGDQCSVSGRSEVRWLQWKHMKGAVWWCVEHKVYYLWRIIDGRCEMTSCR